MGAVRRGVSGDDLPRRLLVNPLTSALFTAGVPVVGISGDRKQLVRTLDVVLASLLRRDERVHIHRVSLEKRAVAHLRMSTPSARSPSPASATWQGGRSNARTCCSVNGEAVVICGNVQTARRFPRCNSASSTEVSPSERVAASSSAYSTQDGTAVSLRWNPRGLTGHAVTTLTQHNDRGRDLGCERPPRL